MADASNVAGPAGLRALREVPGRREPFDRLTGHGCNQVEVFVVVENDEIVDLSTGRNDEVGRTGRSMGSGANHEALDVKGALDDPFVDCNLRHRIKVASVSCELSTGARPDKDFDHRDSGNGQRASEKGVRPAGIDLRVAEPNPGGLVDQVRCHPLVPSRKNRFAIVGLHATNAPEQPFAGGPVNHTLQGSVNRGGGAARTEDLCGRGNEISIKVQGRLRIHSQEYRPATMKGLYGSVAGSPFRERFGNQSAV
jgi:hypothetical protein